MLKKYICLVATFAVFLQCLSCVDGALTTFRSLPTARLSQAEWPSYNIFEPDGPGTYAFGYEIEDIASGNVQFRDEERLRNGTVRGSYGHMQPDGSISITTYTSDARGYRAKTEVIRRPLPDATHYLHDQATHRPYVPSLVSPFVPAVESSHSNVISPAVAAAILNQQQSITPTQMVTNENHLSPEIAAAILQGQQQLLTKNDVQEQRLRPISQFIEDDQNIRSKDIPKDDPFFQNSKLATFFTSPYYVQNIYSQFSKKSAIPEVEKLSAPNALTKEAPWYKKYLAEKHTDGSYSGEANTQIPPEYST